MLQWIKSQDNIAFAIAVLSFAMTALLWTKDILRSYRNLEIQILDHSNAFSVCQLFISLQNGSSAPLCVSSVLMNYGDGWKQCELLPKKIRGEGERMIYTPMFPINLSPHQGYFCFLEFLFCEGSPLVQEKTVALLIQTNRGTVEKTITLGDKAHYLHIK